MIILVVIVEVRLLNFVMLMFVGNVCKREILMEMGTGEKIVDLDVDFMEPQLCATMACDIYQHLRATEVGCFI